MKQEAQFLKVLSIHTCILNYNFCVSTLLLLRGFLSIPRPSVCVCVNLSSEKLPFPFCLFSRVPCLLIPFTRSWQGVLCNSLCHIGGTWTWSLVGLGFIEASSVQQRLIDACYGRCPALGKEAQLWAGSSPCSHEAYGGVRETDTVNHKASHSECRSWLSCLCHLDTSYY